MMYLYWIKRKHHTDPHTQGYIGVSTNPKRRFCEHKKSKNLYLKRSLEKHEDIEMVILEEFSDENECLLKEREYRPSERIGWNLAEGGGLPPNVKGKKDIHKKISETLKSKGYNPYTKNTHSPESVKKRKKSMTGRKWYINPETRERLLCKEPPEGFIAGKKFDDELTTIGKRDRGLIPKKVIGVNFVARKDLWKVITPEGKEYIITNLKNWCEKRGIKYSTVYGNYKGWQSKNLK